MKKLALALTLSGIFLTGATSAMADISHGLSIMGRLETAKSGCTVLMSKYVVSLYHEDKSLPVQGTTINSAVSDDQVYIQLGGEHCDASETGGNIGLKFIGTPDNAMGNTLANIDTGSDAAKGVGVQLSDMQNAILTPNLSVGHFYMYKNGAGEWTHTTSFPLNFALVQLKGQTSTPGKIQTNMTVQIERL